MTAATDGTSPYTDVAELYDLVAEGRPNHDIAARLGVSPSLVKGDLARAYERLGVSERAAAVAVAMRRGLIH
jgi:two-component system nitrate/nitrite response regulator NarL